MKIRILSLFITISAMASAQTPADTIADQSLHEVTVKARRPGVTNLDGALNGHNISRAELFKAACCNLGESFSTNPSVDVSYNDAATGARQIKLLGLAGTYVQMLTEQLPNFRGAATPYALGYVPGPWMKSIQVSKGSASVKNGYESITGQINVEYLKPEDEQAVEVNLFGDSKSRIEANAAANLHVGERASGNLMLHYENSINNHDENHDGFYDKPRVEQYNAQSRWLWKGDRYIFHGGLSGLKEKRRGGQSGHGMAAETPLFGISVNTDRYEAYAKNAFIINPEHATNVALMASGSVHETDAVFGGKTYYVNEKNAYVSLMFETNFSERHNLSAGLSLNHDYFGQLYRLSHSATDATRDNEKETHSRCLRTVYADSRQDPDSNGGNTRRPQLGLRHVCHAALPHKVCAVEPRKLPPVGGQGLPHGACPRRKQLPSRFRTPPCRRPSETGSSVELWLQRGVKHSRCRQSTESQCGILLYTLL